MTFGVRDPEKYTAGAYRASLRYRVEAGSLREDIGVFDLDVEIEPVFELNIQPEFSGVIEFRDLKPQGPAQKSEVLIGVKSNLGKRYQITQRILSGLSSKEGKIVPSKFFTVRQEPLQTKGSLRVPAAVEVAAGETVVFTSDKNGSSDEFKMVYELTPAIDIPAGDYSTRISYSISEL